MQTNPGQLEHRVVGDLTDQIVRKPVRRLGNAECVDQQLGCIERCQIAPQQVIGQGCHSAERGQGCSRANGCSDLEQSSLIPGQPINTRGDHALKARRDAQLRRRPTDGQISPLSLENTGLPQLATDFLDKERNVAGVGDDATSQIGSGIWTCQIFHSPSPDPTLRREPEAAGSHRRFRRANPALQPAGWWRGSEGSGGSASG